MTRNHFIIVGRTSEAIADGILRDFGAGPGLQVNEPGNVFQARFGTFGDGESIFELFVDGKLPDHPIGQHLNENEKQRIVAGLNGAHVTIIHSTSGENTSSRANSLLDGIYDLKQNYQVGSITLINPHLPYMRNDRRFRRAFHEANGAVIEKQQRNALSGRNYARRLRQEGLDRVVAFEAHSRDGVKHYRDFFWAENSRFSEKRSVEFINTAEFFADRIAKANDIVDAKGQWLVACGSPDGLNKPRDYGIMRAKRFALKLYANTIFAQGCNMHTDLRDIPFMFGIHKERINEKVTEIVGFHGTVENKDCIIIDDIYSSGGTTIEAAKQLKKYGAKSIRAIATHGVLVNGALPRLLDSIIDEIHVTDTVTSVNEKAAQYGLAGHPKLFIHTLSPLVNDEIRKDNGLQPGLAFAYPQGEPTPQVF